MRGLFACLGWVLIIRLVVALEDSLFTDDNDLLPLNNNNGLLALNSNDDLLDFYSNNDPSSYGGSDANDIFSLVDHPPVDGSLMTLETADNAGFLLADTTGTSCVSSGTDVGIGTGIVARGEACRIQPKTAPYTKEDERVRHPSEVNDYWCSTNSALGLGTMPVCSLIPPEEIFEYYVASLSSTLITPVNYFSCPDSMIFCCGYWVPDFSKAAGRSSLLKPLGIAYACWRSIKAAGGLKNP